MKNLRTYLIIIATITSISVKSQIQVDSTGNVTIGDSAQMLKINGSVQVKQNFISLNGVIGSYFNTNLTFVPGTFTNDLLPPAMTMYPFKVDSSGTTWPYINICAKVGIFPTIMSRAFVPEYALDLGIYPTSIIRAFNVSPSDSTLKTNIKNLQGARASLLKLRGVTYKLKAKPNPSLNNPNSMELLSNTKSESTKFPQNIIDTTYQNRIRIGFLAQDVQKVYPELVYSDKNGLLSLDYIGLIPVLVESIKELTFKSINDSLAYVNNQTLMLNRIKSDSISIAQLTNNLNTITNQVASLTAQVNQCCSKTTTATTSSDQIPIGTVENVTQKVVQSDVATLSQNAPNPFNQNTTIGYYIPANVSKAVLYVYNLQGVQIKSIPIYDRGNGSVVVSGNSLAAGMYIYSLITDGNVIDTKRMILTN